MKICLITARLPPIRCGVGDYSIQLGNYFVSRGDDVLLLTTQDQADVVAGAEFPIRNSLASWGIRGMPQLWREVRTWAPDVVLVQWVPFLYSRTGTNLVFPLTVAALAATGVAVQVVVHEPWVRFIWWSYFLTGPVQRLALAILVSMSTSTAVSIRPWRDLLRSRLPWRRSRIEYVPVGSNIPIVPLRRRGELRAKAGIPHDAVVLAVFSLHGAAKAFSFVDIAWRDVSSLDASCYLVVIGATADEAAVAMPQAARHPRCRVTGFLTAGEVSAWLQATDLLLAPFTDGMSTRRTSVITAMAHGVPVVTTRGPLTDASIFDGSPLILSDPNPEAFSRDVSELCRNTVRRKELRAAIESFYARHFSWAEIGGRLVPAQ